MTDDLLLGMSKASTIRFVQDDDPSAVVDLQIEPRDWDVNDPEARVVAAKGLLGEDYNWYREHNFAQWWIDPERNAAGLAVFRARQG